MNKILSALIAGSLLTFSLGAFADDAAAANHDAKAAKDEKKADNQEDFDEADQDADDLFSNY